MWKHPLTIIVLMIFITLSSVTVEAADTLTNGLVGYWQFDEIGANRSFQDFSPLANSPGVGAVNVAIVDGNVGLGEGSHPGFARALQFEATSTVDNGAIRVTPRGGQYVKVNRFSSPQWSLSMWINPKVPLPNSYMIGTMFSGDRDTAANRSQFISVSNKGINVYWDIPIVAYDFVANPGWHHVVVTYDGATLTATVDGLTSGSIPYRNNMMALAANRLIGVNSETSTGHTFWGLIDEVRLYNRVLTKAEIILLFDPNAEIPTTPPLVTKIYPNPAMLPLPEWTKYTHIALRADRKVVCRAATTPGVSFQNMPHKFNDTAQKKVYLNILYTQPAQNFTYYVRCEDIYGFQNTNDLVFNVSIKPDTRAPVIEDLASSAVRNTTAEIVWTTKEASNSVVEYWEEGTTAVKTSTSFAYGIPHAEQLRELKPNTSYHYKVTSTDRSGNRSAIAQGTFKTQGKAPQYTYYIAPNGNDNNDGSIARPFATLEKARDKIRSHKTKGEIDPAQGGVQVFLRQGYYFRTTPFVLTDVDTGTAETPIRYSAYNNERVVISGGKEISGFAPVPSTSPVYGRLSVAPVSPTDPTRVRDRILQIDLRAQGITNFGVLNQSGAYIFYHQPTLNLFFEDKPMVLARWPNANPSNLYASFSKIKSVPPGTTDIFVAEDTRPSRWANLLNDVWVHGAWFFDHRDTHLKLTSAAPEPSGGYRLRAPKIIDGKPMPEKFEAKRPFYYENILEELDSPGEWYLDRSTGMLYFYPPTNITTSKTYVSVAPMLVSLESTVSHITFSGLIFEHVKGTVIKMNQLTSNNMVEDCIIRNAYIGLYIAGRHNGVWGSKIYNFEDNAIILFGGVDTTLVNGFNFVVNNEIHTYGLRNYSYRAAVNMAGSDVIISASGPTVGVGDRVRYNKIYNSRHMGIVFKGNNHIIDFNDVSDIGNMSLDVGAIYGVAPAVYRGVLIRHNYIHDLKGFNFTNNRPGLHVVGIYLDNDIDETTVYGNVMNRIEGVEGNGTTQYSIEGVGFLMNGGRDNVFENNIVVNSDKPMLIGAMSYAVTAKMFRIPIEDVSVSATTIDGGRPLIVKTIRSHGNEDFIFEYNSPERVIVAGVLGEPGANSAENGQSEGWAFDLIDSWRMILKGTTAQGRYTEGGYILQNSTPIYERLKYYKYNIPPFSDFYPNLSKRTTEPHYAAIDIIDDAEPKGNDLMTNIFSHNRETNIPNMYSSTVAPKFIIPINNFIGDPQFVDAAKDNFQLKDSSRAYSEIGFKRIPFNEIGLFSDLNTPDPEDPVIYGDVTGNERISLFDAVTILRYKRGLIEFIPQQMRRADVNNNGVIDDQDAILVGQYAMGLISSFATVK